jgi:hypothetical protein
LASQFLAAHVVVTISHGLPVNVVPGVSIGEESSGELSTVNFSVDLQARAWKSTWRFFLVSDDVRQMAIWREDLATSSMEDILQFQADNRAWSKDLRRETLSLVNSRLSQRDQPGGLLNNSEVWNAVERLAPLVTPVAVDIAPKTGRAKKAPVKGKRHGAPRDLLHPKQAR